MAEEEATAGGSEKASMRDHIDNPLVFLVVVGFFVFALGCFGRAAGNRLGQPGVTAFFGG